MAKYTFNTDEIKDPITPFIYAADRGVNPKYEGKTYTDYNQFKKECPDCFRHGKPDEPGQLRYHQVN